MHSTLGACALVLTLIFTTQARAHGRTGCLRELTMQTPDQSTLDAAAADLHDQLTRVRKMRTVGGRTPTNDNDNARVSGPGAGAAAVLEDADRTLRRAGLDQTSLEAVPLAQPAARGLRAALGRLRMHLGAAVPVDSDGASVGDLRDFADAPALAVAHVGVAAIARAFRRTSARAFARSRDALLNTLFVLDINVGSRWPNVFGRDRRGGLPPGWREFTAAQGVMVAAPTIFFYLAFRHGAYRWEALVADDPARATEARRTTSALTNLVFALSGPVLAWATAPAHALSRLGPVSLHPGQLTLTGLAIGAGVLAARPHLFDHAVPWIDRLVYGPLAKTRAYGSGFLSQNETASLVRPPLVDK